MDGLKLGRLYKGEEYTMTLPVPFSSDVDDFQFLLFTDSATTVEIQKSQITINDGVMEFTVHETDLDVLNDGVLNYYLKYTVGSTDKIQCTNTMHYLKSPDDYNPETTTDIYNNGYQSGYTQGLEDAGGEYADGYAAGIEEQKSKLSGITITENGEYTRADGYSGITVNVPQTGTVATYQTKNFSIDNNGDTTITVDDGYDGITGGTIHVSVPQTGHTDAEITAAYNSGYTAGEAEGEVAGAAAQKALLVSTAITENGVYTRENGYNSVNVSIAQTGHTDAELEQAYNNGYTTGEAAGEVTGAAAQKALLVTTAITQNGVYTRENGYSEVSVNVPSSVSNVMAKFPGSFGSWYDTSSFLHNNGQVLSIKFTLPDNQYSRHIYDSSDEDGEGGIYIVYSSHNNVSQITCDFDDEDLLIFSLTGYTFPLQCVLTLTYKQGDYLIGKLTTDTDEQVVTNRGVPTFTLDSSLGFCFNNYRDDYAFSQSGLVIDYLRLYDIDSNNNKTIAHNFEFDGTNFVDYLSNNVSTTNYEIVSVGSERARVRTDTVPSSVTRTYINDSMALYQSKDFQITQTTQITVDAPYDGITGGTITPPSPNYPNYNMYYEGGLNDNLRYSTVFAHAKISNISYGQTNRQFVAFFNVSDNPPYTTLTKNSQAVLLNIDVANATGITYFQPPECITNVNSDTFTDATSLKYIEGFYFTKIGSNAFKGCTSLTIFTFGPNIETIGNYAFKDCSSLSSISISSTNPPTFGTGVFENLPVNGTLSYTSGCDYNSWLAVLPNGWTAQQY